MKVKTYLPIFSGFYESQWQFDYNYIEDFIQEERKEKNLFSKVDFNDLKIDYSAYENDIVNLFCETLPKFLPDFINKIELENIGRKNCVNVEIDIKENEVKSFIYSNKEKFCEFLKSCYTSYDGFFSHYSPEFETWESETKEFSDFSINGHYIGAILDFIAIMKKIDNFSIYEEIFEDIDFLSYVENLEEIINFSDNSLFEFFTKNGFSKTWADYIETSFNNGMIDKLALDEKTLSIIREFENQVVEA